MKPCPVIIVRLFDFGMDGDGQLVAHHEVMSRTKKVNKTLFKTKRKHQVGDGLMPDRYVPFAFSKAGFCSWEYRSRSIHWDRDAETVWLIYRRRFMGEVK